VTKTALLGAKSKEPDRMRWINEEFCKQHKIKYLQIQGFCKDC